MVFRFFFFSIFTGESLCKCCGKQFLAQMSPFVAASMDGLILLVGLQCCCKCGATERQVFNILKYACIFKVIFLILIVLRNNIFFNTYSFIF